MTSSQALTTIREEARLIVDVPHAKRIAAAFGFTLEALELVHPRKLRARVRSERVVPLKGADLDEPVIAIEDLAVRIAMKLDAYAPGEHGYESPYHGRGRTAEHIANRAADCIVAAIARAELAS